MTIKRIVFINLIERKLFKLLVIFDKNINLGKKPFQYKSRFTQISIACKL